MRLLHRRLAPGFAVLTTIVAASSSARAEGGADAAAAESLYRDGSAEMEAGKFATACPKLEESFRLDPATGALLTLAVCYERSGKIASAWVRYLDVEARAKKEGDKDREAVAHAKAADLAPRLPRLQITLNGDVPTLAGLEVRRDRTVLTAATLSSTLPVDPGIHVIEVTASGRETVRREVTAVEGKTEQVIIDALAPAQGGGTPPTPPPAAGEGDGGLTGLQIGGLVVGGVGVVGLGVGFAFGAVASGKKSSLEEIDGYQSDGSCTGDVFDQCVEAYDSASSAATMSTVFVIAGGALAAAGVTMVLLGGSSQPEAAKIELSPSFGGAVLRGTL